MTMQQRDTTDDWITLLMLIVGASAFGLFSLSALLAPVRNFLVQHAILVTGKAVMIPIIDGVGLDFWRIAIIAGLGLVFVSLSIAAARRRRRRENR